MFAAWYSVGRIIEDFFRVDVTHGTGLTGSQWTSLVTVIVSVGFLVHLTLRERRSDHELAGTPS